jgi:hypothetical protein
MLKGKSPCYPQKTRAGCQSRSDENSDPDQREGQHGWYTQTRYTRHEVPASRAASRSGRTPLSFSDAPPTVGSPQDEQRIDSAPLVFAGVKACSARAFVGEQGDSVLVASARSGVFAEPVWLALDGIHLVSSNCRH